MTTGQFPEEQDQNGAFKRQPDEFRDWVGDEPGGAHPVVAGRYHLYICWACPWAHRAALTRELMGLHEAVGMTAVDPLRDERGWAFTLEPDPLNGFRFLSEAYQATLPGFTGRVTVPVLWDKETGRIVNNSEDDICPMFAGAFRPLARHPLDLFPEDLKADQKALSADIYDNIGNAVYEAGFATTQAAYEAGVRQLFDALDRMEKRLAGGRFLFGDRLVESDLRLFCPLVRFDAVYHTHFKCNIRRIADYPNLTRFLKDVYGQPGVAGTVNMDHIKRHYYVTHDDINPFRIVPLGPELDWLNP